jgi:hypothetical protein
LAVPRCQGEGEALSRTSKYFTQANGRKDNGK